MTHRNEKLDSFLDETYPVVQIGSLSFNPSRIVFELDETAYRCMCSDLGFDDDDPDDDDIS